MAAPSPSASSLVSTSVLLTVVGGLAAVGLGYYLGTASHPSARLHRSNAVHRRRPRRRPGDRSDATEEPDEPDDRDDAAPRNGQNILQLLFRVSEDATRKSAYVHRGCACNSCSMVPIRGTRYRCANCADFDLCEACEAQGLHTKTHVFYKVRIPASYLGPKQMQPVWYPGDPESCLRVLPKELVARLSKDTGFERPELDAYWEQFTFMANTEWREDPDDLCLAMDRETFDRALVPSGSTRHVAPSLIHDRMFAFYDTNHDSLIGFSEFVHGLAYRRKRDKLRRIFEGYDLNGDGYVDRKDFLRMFRSYYVLFKQMHHEVLDGVEEQALTNPEAVQLVTSRQPISSLYGRDGRFPAAADGRAGEGKTVQAYGDLYISDGRGVISDSSHDHGDRNDAIVDAFAREFRRNHPPILFENRYWATLSNPPPPDDLQHQVLDGLFAGDSPERPTLQETARRPDDDDDLRSVQWPPPIVTREDVEAACGVGIAVADVPVDQRRQVLESALARFHAESIRYQARGAFHELHERWKRRRFYTDEEEGAEPPLDWHDDEDVLGDAAPPPTTSRSRSSSKVRFAEDDDLDTRSNPSTSSRSVPERWGGIEIPDAERDAGKEILYQVTQQALNELLDQIFKKEEDLAMDVMSTKREREKYRPSLAAPDFVQWAAAMDTYTPFSKSSLRPREAVYGYLRQSQDVAHQVGRTTSRPEARAATAVDLDEVRQLSLDHLLEFSGYSLDDESVVGVDLRPRRTPVAGATHDARVRDEVAAELGALGSTHRDPTMPQFRPDAHTPPVHDIWQMPASLDARSEQDQKLWRSYLLRLRRLDMLEREAERRGGWGRLAYDEFAKVLEGLDSRIEYLGLWIDFCIPNGS